MMESNEDSQPLKPASFTERYKKITQSQFDKGLSILKEKNNFFGAWQCFQLAANNGHVNAQYQLGKMYQRSQVPTLDRESDIQNASFWFNKAAIKGHFKSELRLSLLKLSQRINNLKIIDNYYLQLPELVRLFKMFCQKDFVPLYLSRPNTNITHQAILNKLEKESPKEYAKLTVMVEHLSSQEKEFYTYNSQPFLREKPVSHNQSYVKFAF